jgi:alanine-glyoxylate transaminase/(R)-3-amino-2-methylpropionate-pyruvate transaminase
MTTVKATHGDNRTRIETDWSYDSVATRRKKFLAPSLRTFTAYERPIVVKRGKGQYVWDESGKRFLDCLGQNLTISVGHSHPRIQEEVLSQIEMLQHCTTMYYHPVPAHFAEELVAKMPAGEDWVIHFVNSGAEAIDLAILLARVHTGNYDVIGLREGYHGLHFSTMALTAMHICRQPIPLGQGFLHVANPNQYRGIFGAVTQPYVDEIDNVIKTSTSGSVAGFVAEPIQGFGGVIPLPPGYLAKSFERVRAAGGLCISDEVQTGFGRVGTHFWGFEAHGVVPDIIVMGKGISNGFPLSAVAVKRDIAEAMTTRKFFNTYAANPIACAAGRAVLRIIEEEGMEENARKIGGLMLDAARELQKRHSVIGDVRGAGLFIGIELVKDRTTKEPATEATAKVAELLKENGIILSRSGMHGNVLRISPPLCIDESDAAYFAENLAKAFDRLEGSATK